MTSVRAIDQFELEDADSTPMRRRLRRLTAVLFMSTLFGIGGCVGGLTVGLLTMVEFVAPSTGLYSIGAMLIGGSFILFGIAAHCLDEISVADRAVRLEYCRQHGLRDEDEGTSVSF